MEMIERIASCIKGGSTFDQEDRLEMARNILETMRKPTESMKEAGWDAGSLGDSSWDFAGPDDTWTAMIEAALLEPNK